MAKIKFGAVITDSRGGIGGQQLRMSRYGNVLSNKPHQPTKLTSHAAGARALFGNYSKRWWSTLTSTQRDDWRTLAAANPITNAWGDEYPLTGLAFYIKLNTRLVTAGLAPTDDAPTDQAVTSLVTLTLAATAPDSLVLTYTGSPVPTDYRLYVFATGAISPGVTNFDGKFFFITALAAATASPHDIGTEYLMRLPQLFVGRQYAVSAALLNTTNAALSPPLIASAIAT